MTKRKKVKVREYASIDFDVPIVDLISQLQKLVDTYGESVATEEEYGYGETYLYVVWERDETDAEMEKRLKAAEKAKVRRKAAAAKREASERAQPARLMKKYGEG